VGVAVTVEVIGGSTIAGTATATMGAGWITGGISSEVMNRLSTFS
jgi:hypothetical protein